MCLRYASSKYVQKLSTYTTKIIKRKGRFIFNVL